jgi:hypothetical protein
MQTKFSYRAVKWTVFMGMAAALASACVVSTGDGGGKDIDIDDGGESGSSSTSGTKNTGGTKAGTSGSGGTSAGTSGSTAMGGEGGAGTPADPDYPGVCSSTGMEPTVLDGAACDAKGADNDCAACLKMKCCEPYKTCYGKEPTSACGYGTSPATYETDRGQFDCVLDCYERDNDGVKEESKILEDCQGECFNQCSDTDMFVNDDTLALIGCAMLGADDDAAGDDDCHDACFPPPM